MKESWQVQLINNAWLSSPDPILVFLELRAGTWKFIGQTEMIQKTLTAVFEKKIDMVRFC